MKSIKSLNEGNPSEQINFKFVLIFTSGNSVIHIVKINIQARATSLASIIMLVSGIIFHHYQIIIPPYQSLTLVKHSFKANACTFQTIVEKSFPNYYQLLWKFLCDLLPYISAFFSILLNPSCLCYLQYLQTTVQ